MKAYKLDITKAPRPPKCKVKILLDMIVRDEEINITRCFDSVLHLIDGVIINDTGSKDKTIEIINEYMKKHKLEGEVISREWTDDYGINRTYALEDAYKYIRKIKNHDNCIWYVLFMDADDQAFGTSNTNSSGESKDTFFELNNKAHLDLDYYEISKIRSGEKYHFPAMLRLYQNKSKRWRWEGVRHEVPVRLDTSWTPTYQRLTGGYILSEHEGYRSKDKYTFINDAAAFMRGLKRDPEDSRSMYYCAKSLNDAGYPDLAKMIYKRRIKMVGYYQEKYISYIRLGTMRFYAGKYDKKTYKYFEDAYELDKERLEAIHYMVQLENIYGNHQAAWQLVNEHISKMAQIPPHVSFAINSIYESDFYYEAALTAYYLNKLDMYKELIALFIKSTKKDVLKAKIQENIENYPTTLKTHIYHISADILEKLLVDENISWLEDFLWYCKNNKLYTLGHAIGDKIIKSNYDKYDKSGYDLLDHYSICCYYDGDIDESLNIYTYILEQHQLDIKEEKRVDEDRNYAVASYQKDILIYSYQPKIIQQITNNINKKDNILTLVMTTKNYKTFCQTINSFLANSSDYLSVNRWLLIGSVNEKERLLIEKQYPFFEFNLTTDNFIDRIKEITSKYLYFINDHWLFFTEMVQK